MQPDKTTLYFPKGLQQVYGGCLLLGGAGACGWLELQLQQESSKVAVCVAELCTVCLLAGNEMQWAYMGGFLV